MVKIMFFHTLLLLEDPGVNCMPSKLTVFCLQRENGCFMSQMSHESMSQ